MKRHPLFARVYARASVALEDAGVRDHRIELVGGLTGRVLEVGAGNGLNFQHYPPSVSQVVALEPEPYLRRLSQEAARKAPVPVRVVGGVAERLPAPDGSFDAAVASLVLCSVRDQSAALAEIHRVLRSGGVLRFYEHVAAKGGRLRVLQRTLDATLYPHLSGGCHLFRPTVETIRSCGFEIGEVVEFDFRPCVLAAPAAPHVIGTAIRE